MVFEDAEIDWCSDTTHKILTYIKQHKNLVAAVRELIYVDDHDHRDSERSLNAWIKIRSLVEDE